jgi:hypothetical protein
MTQGRPWSRCSRCREEIVGATGRHGTVAASRTRRSAPAMMLRPGAPRRDNRDRAIDGVECVINVDDLDRSRAAPPGNLHAVAAELHEMTKATKELNEMIRSTSLEPA